VQQQAMWVAEELQMNKYCRTEEKPHSKHATQQSYM
jgi:ferredoxin-like protein FixX